MQLFQKVALVISSVFVLCAGIAGEISLKTMQGVDKYALCKLPVADHSLRIVSMTVDNNILSANVVIHPTTELYIRSSSSWNLMVLGLDCGWYQAQEFPISVTPEEARLLPETDTYFQVHFDCGNLCHDDAPKWIRVFGSGFGVNTAYSAPFKKL